MERSYTVTKNILYNLFSQFTLLFVGIFTSPYIIHHLGTDAYGVLALVSVFIGYLSLLDFGLGTAIIKFISEYHARNDKEKLEKVIQTSLFLYVIIGATGAIIISLLANILATKWLTIPHALIPITITVIYISAIGFFINTLFAIFNSVPVALQRMDLTGRRNLLFGLIGTLGMVGLLSIGQNLQIIVIWNVVTDIVATISFVIITKKLLPNISFRMEFHKEVFQEMIKFGLFKFVGNVTGQIVFQVDRLLIGLFQPIASVTYYAVALTIVQKGFTALINITTAVFPAISSASGVKDYDRVRDLYLRMTKFVLFLMLPVTTVLVTFSYELIHVWQRDKIIATHSSPVLQILAIAYLIAALSGPAVTVTEAMGKPQLSATFSTISAAINFAAAITLIPRFGIIGAALAMLINFLAQVPLFIYISNKKIINISSTEMIIKTYIRPTIATTLAIIVSLFAISAIHQEIWHLLFGLLTFGIIYLVANLLVGTFDDRDKQMALHFLKRFKK